MGAVGITKSGNADEEFPALLTILKKSFAKKLPWESLASLLWKTCSILVSKIIISF